MLFGPTVHGIKLLQERTFAFFTKPQHWKSLFFLNNFLLCTFCWHLHCHDSKIFKSWIRIHTVLRIRDVYPGSRILILTHPGSKNSNKRQGWKKKFFNPFFVATNFRKLNIILFLICWRKKFGPIFQELLKFLPKKLSPSPQKYGFGIRVPRSGIRIRNTETTTLVPSMRMFRNFRFICRLPNSVRQWSRPASASHVAEIPPARTWFHFQVILFSLIFFHGSRNQCCVSASNLTDLNPSGACLQVNGKQVNVLHLKRVF